MALSRVTHDVSTGQCNPYSAIHTAPEFAAMRPKNGQALSEAPCPPSQLLIQEPALLLLGSLTDHLLSVFFILSL